MDSPNLTTAAWDSNILLFYLVQFFRETYSSCIYYSLKPWNREMKMLFILDVDTQKLVLMF